MSDSRRSIVLVALQQALLGEVTDRLRCVTVRYSDVAVHFTAYVDGALTDDDREAMSRVETELMAVLPESEAVSHTVVRLDAPAPLPKDTTWVYYRAEPDAAG